MNYRRTSSGQRRHVSFDRAARWCARYRENPRSGEPLRTVLRDWHAPDFEKPQYLDLLRLFDMGVASAYETKNICLIDYLDKAHTDLLNHEASGRKPYHESREDMDQRSRLIMELQLMVREQRKQLWRLPR